MPSVWKLAVATFIGTAIEWYDFFLYGTAAALVFNRLFFPEFDPGLGRLAALATFAVGYLARPLGAAVFGHLGDTRGRKSMLFLTLLTMGVATALIGVLPAYAQVGVIAPVMLVALRMLQGVGLGGEWGGAVLMAFEHAPSTRRGFFASWPQMGAPVGLLLANFVFVGISSLPDSEFLTWGWRVPFVLSMALVGLGLLVRRGVGESPEFQQLKGDNTAASQPLIDVLRGHRRAVLVAAGSRAAEAGFVTIFTTFVVSYVVLTAGLSRPAVLSAVILGTVCTPLLVLLSGAFADRWSRRRVYLAGAIVATLVALPACLLIDSRQFALIAAGIVLGTLGPGLMFGPQPSFMAELFPARLRSSGTSLGFQLGGVLSGGVAPVLAAALVGLTGNLLPVAGLMLVLGLISIAALVASRGSLESRVGHSRWTLGRQLTSEF